MNRSSELNDAVYVNYEDKNAINVISNTIISYLPSTLSPIVVLCIGTDRSTGDSLGPLTGTILANKTLQHINVYGTLHEPIHAMNLQDKLIEINNTFHKPYIIAIDAALGKANSIGNIFTQNGPLQPGSALKKDLPDVGNTSITGVVNVSGVMEYAVLQSTRLSIVHDIAVVIASILYRIDCALRPYYFQPRSSTI